jgi:2-hydroxy-3-keto-5-methylthiopentenyl-1-phosphate phosphatase
VADVQIVVDWDGTVTEVDGLYEIVRTFGDERIFEKTEGSLGRDLTLNEVISIEVETITAPLPAVVEWARENLRLRAGFANFARSHRPLIVSSGFHELIDPLLERDGITARVVANRLDPRPDGWRTLFREQEACAVCGEPCKRSDVAGLNGFLYVGDGFSDRCVAEAASRVFARDGLAEYLAGRGSPFEPFTDFRALEARLSAEAS